MPYGHLLDIYNQNINKRERLYYYQLGMATDWVRGGFFDTRTRPAGPLLLPRLGMFNKLVIFFAPNPARWVSAGPLGHVQPLLGLIHGPVQSNLIYIYIYITQTTTQINQHCYQSCQNEILR